MLHHIIGPPYHYNLDSQEEYWPMLQVWSFLMNANQIKMKETCYLHSKIIACYIVLYKWIQAHFFDTIIIQYFLYFDMHWTFLRKCAIFCNFPILRLFCALYSSTLLDYSKPVFLGLNKTRIFRINMLSKLKWIQYLTMSLALISITILCLNSIKITQILLSIK